MRIRRISIYFGQDSHTLIKILSKKYGSLFSTNSKLSRDQFESSFGLIHKSVPLESLIANNYARNFIELLDRNSLKANINKVNLKKLLKLINEVELLWARNGKYKGLDSDEISILLFQKYCEIIQSNFRIFQSHKFGNHIWIESDKKKTTYNYFINDSKRDESGSYCSACQETPCQCSDPDPD